VDRGSAISLLVFSEVGLLGKWEGRWNWNCVRETGLWVVGGRGVLWFFGMKLEIELMETRFLARRLVRWILACYNGFLTFAHFQGGGCLLTKVISSN
jgi:hypothetical protein